MPPRSFTSLLGFAFHHFYNRFAFTYDLVAAIVSRGDWVAWTCAALPFVRGPRILEIAFGTGNLHLALAERAGAKFAVVGIDLSPYMIRITRNKFARVKNIPRLAQARAQYLPFPANYFDDVIVTFPAPFILQEPTQKEIARVLKSDGQLIWVDAGRVKPTDAWGRFLNWALDFTTRGSEREPIAYRLPRAFFDWRVERVEFARTVVMVMIGAPLHARG